MLGRIGMEWVDEWCTLRKVGVTEGRDPQFANRYAGGMMSKSYDSLASGTKFTRVDKSRIRH